MYIVCDVWYNDMYTRTTRARSTAQNTVQDIMVAHVPLHIARMVVANNCQTERVNAVVHKTQCGRIKLPCGAVEICHVH